MNTLDQAHQMIEDSFYSLRKELSQFQLDPEALEEKESRLSQIRKIQKKYGSDLNEIANIFKQQQRPIPDGQKNAINPVFHSKADCRFT